MLAVGAQGEALPALRLAPGDLQREEASAPDLLAAAPDLPAVGEAERVAGGQQRGEESGQALGSPELRAPDVGGRHGQELAAGHAEVKLALPVSGRAARAAVGAGEDQEFRAGRVVRRGANIPGRLQRSRGAGTGQEGQRALPGQIQAVADQERCPALQGPYGGQAYEHPGLGEEAVLRAKLLLLNLRREHVEHREQRRVVAVVVHAVALEEQAAEVASSLNAWRYLERDALLAATVVEGIPHAVVALSVSRVSDEVGDPRAAAPGGQLQKLQLPQQRGVVGERCKNDASLPPSSATALVAGR